MRKKETPMRRNNLAYIERLSEITQKILNEKSSYGELQNTLVELKSLFTEVSGLDWDAQENDAPIYLETGKAIGPKWAGMCIDDLLRTVRFIRAIFSAVRDLLEKKGEEPVTILYTGTGPFATLVMPLTTLFSSEELQFIFLEVNPKSLESLNKIILGFGIEDYVIESHNCDASIVKLSNRAKEVDVLLIECLQHALAREPQVAITYNLLPQMKEDVVLIPEEIVLHVAGINTKRRNEQLNGNFEITNESYFENYESVFTLNKDEVFAHLMKRDSERLDFSEVKTIFSRRFLEENSVLAITTEMILYKEEVLTFNESGLTIPLIFAELNSSDIVKGTFTKYLATNDPRLETTIIK